MGEHLPCKQGVKSSNLSVSIDHKEFLMILSKVRVSYKYVP